jgi:predicted DNA-binding transcriptional regulator AlpA
MIKLGVFPPPVKVGRKSLWKVEELGKALERFEAKR